MGAFAIGAHAWHEGLDAVEHAAAVHVHAPLVIVAGGLGHLGAHADAGVVDQQVHAAELLLGLVGHFGPAGDVGDVVLDGVDALFVFEQGQGGFDLAVVDVAEDDLHALVVGRAGDAKANAAGGAGDVGDLAGDVTQGGGAQCRGGGGLGQGRGGGQRAGKAGGGGGQCHAPKEAAAAGLEGIEQVCHRCVPVCCCVAPRLEGRWRVRFRLPAFGRNGQNAAGQGCSTL